MLKGCPTTWILMPPRGSSTKPVRKVGFDTPEKPFEKPYAERKSKGLFDIPANPNRPNHMSNFLECVRSRKNPHCNEDVGYTVMAAIGLGVEAYRRNRTMRFDAKTGRVFEV